MSLLLLHSWINLFQLNTNNFAVPKCSKCVMSLNLFYIRKTYTIILGFSRGFNSKSLFHSEKLFICEINKSCSNKGWTRHLLFRMCTKFEINDSQHQSWSEIPWWTWRYQLFLYITVLGWSLYTFPNWLPDLTLLMLFRVFALRSNLFFSFCRGRCGWRRGGKGLQLTTYPSTVSQPHSLPACARSLFTYLHGLLSLSEPSIILVLQKS
jgi:hypothetical protein